MPDCVVALWEGPQLLLAKVKDADGHDWYIFGYRHERNDFLSELLADLS